MNEKDVLAILSKYSLVYPNYEATPSVAKLWCEYFADCHPSIFADALAQAVEAKEDFFPTVATVKAYVRSVLESRYCESLKMSAQDAYQLYNKRHSKALIIKAKKLTESEIENLKNVPKVGGNYETMKVKRETFYRIFTELQNKGKELISKGYHSREAIVEIVGLEIFMELGYSGDLVLEYVSRRKSGEMFDAKPDLNKVRPLFEPQDLIDDVNF